MRTRLAALLLLAAAIAAGACNAKHAVSSDAGLTNSIEVCSFDSGAYVGFVDLSLIEYSDPDPSYHLQGESGGSMQFFPRGNPFAPSALPAVFAATFCGNNPAPGQCCTGPLTSDAGGSADSGEVGVEYVTCLDPQNPNASTFGMTDQYGGLSWPAWSGGDSLVCSGDGGVVGAFTATISTPPTFAGLSPVLFPGDSGPATLSRTGDLVVTWTAGAASSSVAINLANETTMVACLAADDGSFTIPSAFLSGFQSGEQGFIAVFRYQGTCAPSVPVSFFVESGVGQYVVFQ